MKKRLGRPPMPGLRFVGIRLFERDLRAARRQARRVKQPYQCIIRQWVADAAARAA
jgi:hypothetical protein